MGTDCLDRVFIYVLVYNIDGMGCHILSIGPKNDTLFLKECKCDITVYNHVKEIEEKVKAFYLNLRKTIDQLII